MHILSYDIYKDDALYVETFEREFTDNFSLGDSAVYKIRGIDINDNIGDFSDDFVVRYGIKGDANWDEVINILDVTRIIYMILFSEEELTEQEFWAGDYNSSNQVEVSDITPVINIITGGALSEIENTGGETFVYIEDRTLYMTSDRPIAGLQLELSQNTQVSNLTALNMASEGNKFLIYTTTESVLQGMDIPLAMFDEDVEVESLLISDNLGQQVSSELKIIKGGMVPEAFAIHQNYPNPFNPETLLRLDVVELTATKISVYDLRGREIKVLVDQELIPGYHQFIWNGTDILGNPVGSGLYFIMVQTPEITQTMKATLLR